MSKLAEPPYEADFRWIDRPDTKCRQCGKPGYGKLMDSRNTDYGWHCKKCADRRMAAAARYREWSARAALTEQKG